MSDLPLPPARLQAAKLAAAVGSVATGFGLQLTIAISGIIAARLLGVADRGRLALLWAVTLVVAQVCTLGLPAAITYTVARGVEPRAVLAQIRRRMPLILAVSPPVTGLISFAATRDHGRPVLTAIALSLVVPPSLTLLLIGLASAQGQRRYNVVQLHRLVQPALYTLVLVGLAIADRGTLPWVTGAWATTMGIGGLWAWRQGTGAWKPPRATDAPAPVTERELLRHGRRSFFGTYGFTEHMMADLLLIGVLLGAGEFGLYATGWTLANLPRFVGQSVGYISYPEVVDAERRGQRGDSTLLRYVLLGAAILAPIVGLLIAVMGWLLPLLFGQPFRAAVPVAQLLVLAALPQALRRIGSESLRGLGSTGPAGAAELVFVITLVAASIPLSLSDGATGAGWAALLAAVAGAVALPALEAMRRRRGAGREATTTTP